MSKNWIIQYLLIEIAECEQGETRMVPDRHFNIWKKMNVIGPQSYKWLHE